MKHFQSKVLTAAILAALSGSAIAATEVYEKSEVDNKITEAKTEVTNALTSKIDTAKNELETKLTAQNESGKEDIKKIKAAVVKITKSLMGEEGNDENPGVFGALQDLNTSVESNKSEIGELKKGLETTNKALDETKKSIDTKVKAAEDATVKAEAAAGKADTAADKADTAAVKAEAAAAKVTNVEKVANAALVEAYNNAQDINGFKAGDTLYDMDKDGKITKKEATAADVEADDFKGLGLKEVVAKHDESLGELTETVNENGEALVKTAEVINRHAETLKTVETAINKNEDAINKNKDAINDTKDDLALVAATAINNVQDINGFKAGDTIYDIDENGKITKKEATAADVEADDFKGMGLKEVVKANTATIAEKADKTELDKVSKKADKNADDIATKANSADVYTKDKVYTKEESDNKFVKINDSIGSLNTTTNGLETRLAAAEKSVADHGTRLASAEKSITEHGTRLNGLDKAVSDLRKETRQGLAEQAALSGLFQPYNVGRFNVTAAVGGYKSESAVAIGTGFRFTENFAAKAGVAVGTSSGSSAAYHVGVNYEW